MQIRSKFTKEPSVRLISHLDVVRVFDRAIRRANLPIAFSKGFNPRPQMNFSFPLPLGVTSSAEYVDMELSEPILPQIFQERLNASLPNGFHIIKAQKIGDDVMPLMSEIDVAVYDIVANLGKEHDLNSLHSIFDRFLKSNDVIVKRKRKRRGRIFYKDMNIRPFIYSLKILSQNKNRLSLEVELNASRGSINLVIQALKKWDDKLNDWETEKVHRKGLYIKKNSELFSPFH
ncbi:MAG TPA: DUF2344 domain-containing protein [Thermoanaerobacterales bacterium]|nr:DUF2344 domain-containing protein [Thermoanaerobacterales bacterium]